MNPQILYEIALNSDLLPESLRDGILTGVVPPSSEVAYHLVIDAVDADAVTAADPNATWTERRLSRQLLGLTALIALDFEKPPC